MSSTATTPCALAYARRGWAVFPAAGKVPATTNGFHAATCDEAQIRDWFSDPELNVAIACGEQLAVLDVDPRHDPSGQALCELLKELPAIPESVPRVATGGGGLHLYFAGPHRTLARVNGLDWLEIRGQGAYVIAPPSVHPDTGRAYTWLLEPHAALLTLPSSLRRPLAQAARPVEEYASIASGIVPEGTRHNTLASMIGRLLRRGVHPRVAWPLIESWARLHLKPPLPAAHVERLFSDLAQREAGRRWDAEGRAA